LPFLIKKGTDFVCILSINLFAIKGDIFILRPFALAEVSLISFFGRWVYTVMG
jgi:hypothetical protein